MLVNVTSGPVGNVGATEAGVDASSCDVQNPTAMVHASAISVSAKWPPDPRFTLADGTTLPRSAQGSGRKFLARGASRRPATRGPAARPPHLVGFDRVPLLEVDGVSKRFGGILALDRVSLDAGEGEIVGLIGPNGAGKTTAFNVVTRLYEPDEGSVVFGGRDLLREPSHRVVRHGIARTFQNVELFAGMTVLENVLVGSHAWARRAGERAARRRALEALAYVGLAAAAGRPAASLPYGSRKRVETARALVSRPRLLLLDEPAGGLNHDEVRELGEFVRRLRDDHELTVLLVEHHMNLVMGISDRVHVLNFGRRIASGTPTEVQRDRDVVEAYLGVEAQRE
jgi:branched-chain amino acid transport system ATP-binding protein